LIYSEGLYEGKVEEAQVLLHDEAIDTFGNTEGLNEGNLEGFVLLHAAFSVTEGRTVFENPEEMTEGLIDVIVSEGICRFEGLIL